jgi:PKHD-type hydroxylase
MFLNKNSFCIIPNAVPTHICDKIIKYGNEHKQKMAVTGNLSKRKKPLTQKEIKDLKKHRNSRVTFLNDWWIQRHIFPAIQEANIVAKWNLSITGHESMQFTKYNKGQFYDWHYDSWVDPYKNNTVRKLSVTVSLSDENDFEGGDLEFAIQDNNAREPLKKILRTCHEVRKKGSLVVFPSFLWHRVTPVIRGTRYSLVIWSTGEPYR